MTIARNPVITMHNRVGVTKRTDLVRPTHVRTDKRRTVNMNQQFSPWRLSVAPMMDWTLCSAFVRAAAVLVANL
jgi:hypothetical protein